MSSKLALDFMPKSALPLLGNIALSLVLLLIGLVAAASTWHLYQDKQNQMTEISNELSQLKHIPIKKEVRKEVEPITISAEKKLQIQETVNTLTMPWDALLGAIEKPDMRDIAVLSFAPNSKNQQIVLEAEAKNLVAALNYVEALQKQAVFDKVYIQKHAIEETNVSKPVRFSVFLHWQLVQG